MHLGSPYFIMLAIGLGLGCTYTVHTGRRLGLARLALIDVCIAAVLGGIVGGRLLHIVAEPLPSHVLSPQEVNALSTRANELAPEVREAVSHATQESRVPAVWAFVANMPPGQAREEAIRRAGADPAEVPAWLWYRSQPMEALAFWKGGLAYMGGLFIAAILCAAVTIHHKVHIGDMADAAAGGIVLGLVFGRIGCFVGGCCYGAACDPAWWSKVPRWHDAALGATHRYPTALTSALLAAVLFAMLHLVMRRRAFRGEVMLAMVASYAPGRFLIEAYRADPRGGAWGLSTSQLLALAVGIPAGITWVTLRLHARKHEPPPSPTGLVGDSDFLFEDSETTSIPVVEKPGPQHG